MYLNPLATRMVLFCAGLICGWIIGTLRNIYRDAKDPS